MSKRRRNRKQQNHGSTQSMAGSESAGHDVSAAESASMEAFTFGDPTPVMSRFDLLYTGCWMAGSRWYEPPVDLSALSKSYRATAHHGSALQVKRNILVKTFEPTHWMSRSTFSSIALDFLVYGNCYGQQIRNRLNRLLSIEPAKAKYMRRGLVEGSYWWVHGWDQEKEFPEGSIIHVMEPDIDQEIYGLPDYIGGLQAAWLNESATLFRRKYYENGSHAGFIMYMTDPAQKQEDVDALREALRNAKGPGNFRNLFMYAPNGKKDGLQLIPVSEVAAKDDFWNIKNVSRDDQLASHRVPPQLMGIIPSNTGGFGDVEKAARVFVANELEPLQERLKEFNEAAGEEVVRFKPYLFPES